MRVVTLVNQQGFDNMNENSCFACVFARPPQPGNLKGPIVSYLNLK